MPLFALLCFLLLPPAYAMEAEPLVAHAGGSIQGRTYLNALEALDLNYEKGFRFFELDFQRTRDHKLVLIHDWGGTFQREYVLPWNLSLPKHLPAFLRRLFGIDELPRPTFEEFTELKLQGQLTPLTLHRLLRWMEGHPDAFVITDFKVPFLAALHDLAGRLESGLKKRFLIQTYDLTQAPFVTEAGFENWILTLYLLNKTDEEILSYCKKNKPFAVTMPLTRARQSSLAQRLAQISIPSYTHTINQTSQIPFLIRKGVSGIYTDHISPQSIPERLFDIDPAQ